MQHLDATGDPLGVHALEAPAHHERRGAVALLARDAEAQCERVGHAGRVQRGPEKRCSRQVVARVELELAEEVAPVRRKLGERRVPGEGKWGLRLGHGSGFVSARATSSRASVPQMRLRSSRPRMFRARSAPASARVTWNRSSEPTRTGCNGARTAAASAVDPSGANESRASFQSLPRAPSICAHCSAARIGGSA